MLSIIALAVIPSALTGQSEEYRRRSNLWEPLGPMLHAMSGPADWSGREFLTLGIVAGATSAAILVEESVHEYFEGNRAQAADDLERIGDLYGHPIFTGGVSLLTLGAGALFDSPKVEETGLMMVESLLLVAFIQQPLRLIAGRARPLTGEGHSSFDPFNVSNEYAAFVSGHTWSAMAISNIISRQVGRTWVSVLVYSLAGVTAWSRLYKQKHWLSDVLVGGVAGYYTSSSIWRWHKAPEESRSNVSLSLVPRGFSVNISF